MARCPSLGTLQRGVIEIEQPQLASTAGELAKWEGVAVASADERDARPFGDVLVSVASRAVCGCVASVDCATTRPQSRIGETKLSQTDEIPSLIRMRRRNQSHMDETKPSHMSEIPVSGE